MEIKELYLVVVSFSPWKSVESVGEKYNFAYVELALIIYTNTAFRQKTKKINFTY